LRYILTRLAGGVVTLLAMTVLVFALVRLRGDPLELLVGPHFITPENRAQLSHALGLDQPIVVQYFQFLWNALHGDFRNSVLQYDPVRDIVLQRLPNSIELAATALVVGIVIGVPLGIVAAVYKSGPLDSLVRVLAMLGQSVPTFVSGVLLIWLFVVTLHWLPSGGKTGPLSFVLPSLVLGWFAASGIMRLVRSSMLDVLSSDYVTFARSKGLPETTVIWHHAFRNAMLPMLTFVGLIFANLLTGSVVVESLFFWPGMGRLAITSVQGGDFPVVQMVVLVFALGFVLVNLTVDVVSTYLNPRIRNA
jgi:peptide/nickel transport system permease protein